VIFSSLPAATEYLKADRLRVLAVTTATRSEALPDIPTMSEFFPGYEASQWYGVGVPKNTPAEIIDKLNKEINAGLADAKMKARLADLGGTVLPGSPATFGKLIADETESGAMSSGPSTSRRTDAAVSIQHSVIPFRENRARSALRTTH
jgi:tripartite-type tricarboxylate transporter receptor subunit TctC